MYRKGIPEEQNAKYLVKALLTRQSRLNIQFQIF